MNLDDVKNAVSTLLLKERIAIDEKIAAVTAPLNESVAVLRSMQPEREQMLSKEAIAAQFESVAIRLEVIAHDVKTVETAREKALEALEQGWAVKHQQLVQSLDEKARAEKAEGQLEREKYMGLLDAAEKNAKSASELVAEQTDRFGDIERAQVEIVKTLQSTEAVQWRHLGGYQKDQKYRKGDCVGRDGATYVCVAEATNIDPREKTETPQWRLVAARGEKGESKAGAPGKTGKGEKGDPGAGLVGVELHNGVLVLASSDGKAHRVDLKGAIAEEAARVIADAKKKDK